ncbi:hypothetical protein [Thioalkalivibrio sp. ALE19]|uniref:hypothetical protein n=1 Tax=Thioalkalivibrio sp. ALE19 TaxID=1266909 RepID=UPI00040C2E50|nr:hypothetical protein [Thioalkalivibrio sp. ALE19]
MKKSRYTEELETLLEMVDEAIEAGRIDEPELPEDANDARSLKAQIEQCREAMDELDDPMDGTFIVITGNPVDGLVHIGPFGNGEEANDYADNLDDEWWVAKIEEP